MRNALLAMLGVLALPLTGEGDYRPDERAARAPGAALAPIQNGRPKYYSQYDPRRFTDPNPHGVSFTCVLPASFAAALAESERESVALHARNDLTRNATK